MPPQYYVGLMSGTSLDGIDAALVAFENGASKLLHTQFIPFGEPLRTELLALNSAGDNELERAALAANKLSRSYAEAVLALLKQSGIQASQIGAIGCHGQTVRHRPDLGFTLQLANPALLAELTGISVVADFRSRDIAAGGHGAPLVPAFHAALFRHLEHHRAIVNIGGISNLTYLPRHGKVLGFDCGPGNLLMDTWAMRHLGQPYDKNGAWAGTGQIIPDLLQKLLAEPFFLAVPPKSTGRDLFNLPWLERFLSPDFPPVDVQATLLELTVDGIAGALETHCKETGEIYLCGGGAHNGTLVRRLKQRLPSRAVALTDDLGVPADWVEAFAFAWLAKQTLDGRPGNLPEVTGAKGERILGAIYLA
ncbi:MAG: anhydro-N-acetylmuramic acid kinase [Betaproteobacteria bacterium]|nr:anhydro-N-acetylmuramic acid kinase [Betaproteobacteria bacterium]